MIDAMKQHGAFSWNELMTSDVEGAKAFYSQLLNWQYDDMKNEDMVYTTAKVAGQMIAGMMPMPPDSGDMPPSWGAYVTVDDVDASAKKAEKLGGKVVMEPRDIPTVGRFCVIVDPQGAALSLITYAEQ